MSNDASQLALICGTSVIINTVAQVKAKRDPVVTVVAGSVAFVGLSMFGGLTGRYDIANAFAWVFLISALILRGIPLIHDASTIATTAKTSTTAKGRSGGGGHF